MTNPYPKSLSTYCHVILKFVVLIKIKKYTTPTVNSSSSVCSFFTANGHQPFTRFCLNNDICGTLPSFFNMFRVHSLEDLAPLGNRFRSRVSAPEIIILIIDRKQKRHINNMSIHFGKQSFLSKK